MTAATLFQSALASLPEIVVITGACILLILGQFVRKGQEHFLVWASVAVVLIAALATLMLASEVRPAYTGMFLADRFAVFFKFVFYLATVLTFLLSRKYADIEGIGSSEYYVLLLFALSGMMIMASATDLLSIYVGIELMVICTYVLTGFLRRERRSNEAALKYVILGAVSTGIFPLWRFAGLRAHRHNAIGRDGCGRDRRSARSRIVAGGGLHRRGAGLQGRRGSLPYVASGRL